jgi:hypothetical protein
MSQIATAPVLTMPEPLQTIFLYATIAITALFVAYGARLSLRRHSSVPLLLILAGFCAIAMETVVTYLGHAEHPVIGNITLFRAVDRSIPWHIALGYTVAFGLLNILVWLKLENRTINPRYIYAACIITVLCYQVGETAGVSTGLWVYFQPQPVWLLHFTAPLPWSFLNAACMIMSTALIMFLLPHLAGFKRLLIPVLGPVGAFMGHMGAGWPMYNVINSAAPWWAMQLSGVAAILLSVVVWWFAALLIMVAAQTYK